VELVSSRMSRTRSATAAPTWCDRAIVVRPIAVPCVPRPTGGSPAAGRTRDVTPAHTCR